MKHIPVVKHPNNILRQESVIISDTDLQSPELQQLIDDMMISMKEENGVGLAAPQIGKHIRLIIAETPTGPAAFINPKIISVSDQIVDSEEGCLSVPGVFGLVKRHKSVKVKAKNRHGEPIRMKATGLLSVIFQHEIDHLNGVLFIDKAFRIIEGESTSAI
ncbi:MAG: peptide deformylase [bacterium]|nr:peptide deformylase [bacterium]MDA1024520.1 peptide deformylase [bacterium]